MLTRHGKDQTVCHWQMMLSGKQSGVQSQGRSQFDHFTLHHVCGAYFGHGLVLGLEDFLEHFVETNHWHQ